MLDQPEKPSRDQVPPKAGNRIWGSDVIAQALREQEIPYVCLNPGASYRGVHDSLVNFLGNKNPQMIVCMHEEHAVSIGHGYALVTGKPLAAFVHSNVGLMHATMAIFNAWCNRMPVIVLGATGPVDAARRRPWIDWIHTCADQGALVRDYTKWDDQPASPAAAVESIRRACILAQARPMAPVYLNFDAAIQEQELGAWPQLEDVSRYRPPADAEPPRAAVEAAVAALAKATSPVILSGRVTRSRDGWDDRVALAEWIGARVITDLKQAASFPTDHPLFAGETAWKLRPGLIEHLRKADVILALDWVDPAGSIHQAFPPGTRGPFVINVSNDHHVHKGWNADYQVLPAADAWLPTVAEAGVTALLEGLARAGVAKRNAPMARRQPKVAMPEESSGAIDIVQLARVFANVTDGEPMCMISRPLGWPPNANYVHEPLDFLGANGGAGVGSGIAMAIGAAIALRDAKSERLPVAVLGDGDFMMGNSALWTAANQDVPLLLIVANNRSYYNDEEHQKHIAEHRGRPVENAPVGQRTEDPAPDLAAIARGMGWDGEGPVADLADVADAIRCGIAAVRAGRRYVVDVLVKPEYVRKPLVDYP